MTVLKTTVEEYKFILKLTSLTITFIGSILFVLFAVNTYRFMNSLTLTDSIVRIDFASSQECNKAIETLVSQSLATVLNMSSKLTTGECTNLNEIQTFGVTVHLKTYSHIVESFENTEKLQVIQDRLQAILLPLVRRIILVQS